MKEANYLYIEAEGIVRRFKLAKKSYEKGLASSYDRGYLDVQIRKQPNSPTFQIN